MKIIEILKSSDKALFEAFDRDNNTGFATEDLVKIARTHEANNWDEIDFDDFMAEIDQLQELDHGSQK